MLSLTVFKNIKDNETTKRMDFGTFDELEKLLYDLSKKCAYKPGKDEGLRRSSPLISPAVYSPGTTRSNSATTSWAGWACLDVDDYEGSLDSILESFGEAYFVCYSTASSTPEKPKFRLVFPLTRHLKKKEIKSFWHALNSEYLNLADAQCKDLSRMYYVPGQYPGAHNFIFTRKGPYIDPDDLMKKHPHVEPDGETFYDRLSPEMQKRFMDHRRAQLTNTAVTWSSYHDCPFVNDRLITEYAATTGGGWYYKMYGIMVSIAGSAYRKGYPITAHEIAALCKQIDADTGGWYQSRPLEMEADRAIEFVFKHSI